MPTSFSYLLVTRKLANCWRVAAGTSTAGPWLEAVAVVEGDCGLVLAEEARTCPAAAFAADRQGLLALAACPFCRAFYSNRQKTVRRVDQ